MNRTLRSGQRFVLLVGLISTFSGGRVSAQTTFSNSTPLHLQHSSTADYYPSNIVISGLDGLTDKVTVKFSGFRDGGPEAVDALLVGPLGQTVLLMSDAGGSRPAGPIDVTFDDSAPGLIPNYTIGSNTNTYQPTNYDAAGDLSDAFPSPAPQAPWGSKLSNFQYTNPNGLWRLYIVSDEPYDGTMSGGWSVTITACSPAARLSFSKQPGSSTPGGALAPQPQVEVLNSCGSVDGTFNGPISLTVTPGTGADDAQLTGHVTVNAVNGIASFTDVGVDRRGENYTLTAAATGPTPAVSTAFDLPGRIRYVRSGAFGNGSTWDTAAGSVQAGINAASTGDELWIAAGTYAENLTLKSGVGLYGGFLGTELARDMRDWTANPTVIDGGHNGPVVTVAAGVGNETVIDGLILQHGDAVTLQAPDTGPWVGAGVYGIDASPTIANCTIQQCGASHAALNEGNVYIPISYSGVVYLTGVGAVIQDNAIADNQAGGLYAPGAIATGNIVTNNGKAPGIDNVHFAGWNVVAGNGGGVNADIAQRNVVTDSVPLSVDHGFLEGGEGVDAQIVDGNYIARNGGGGVTNCTVVNGNWIIGNQTLAEGGGIRIDDGVVSNNLIAANVTATYLSSPTWGGGILVNTGSPSDSVVITNNTIVSNKLNALGNPNIAQDGGGIYVIGSGTTTLTNNIVAFNDSGVAGYPRGEFGTFIARNNDIYGNEAYNYSIIPDPTGTNGNVSVDPQFVNAAAGNYHVQPTSPCVDAGDDSAVSNADGDLEEAPRIVGPHVDMGAYETLSSLPFTFAEALKAVRILGGLTIGAPTDLQRLNVVGVAPSANLIDMLDATRLIRKAAGLDFNP